MLEAQEYAGEDLRVGLRVAYEREVTEEDVLTFARLTGDHNPLHVDDEYARRSNYEGRIAHGAFQVGLASALLGMNLPGKRVLLGSVNSRFPAPLYFPARISVSGEIAAWNLASLTGQLHVTIREVTSSNITAEIFMGFSLHEQKREQIPRAFAGSDTESAGQKDTKVLVLTGASGGLGGHILSALADDYQVLAVVNQRPLDEDLRTRPNVSGVRIDIAEPSLEQHLSSLIGDRPLYGVVHAAWPGAAPGSLLAADDDAINNQLAFGAIVTVRLARILFKHVHQDGGRLIGLSSTAGTVKPNLQMGVYSLGKTCLEHTLKLLAPELARKRITANAVCPSFVPVGMNKQVTERQIMMQSAAVPLGRVCDADDVTAMIRYLLSPEAAFVSGQSLALTGAQL